MEEIEPFDFDSLKHIVDNDARIKFYAEYIKEVAQKINPSINPSVMLDAEIQQLYFDAFKEIRDFYHNKFGTASNDEIKNLSTTIRSVEYFLKKGNDLDADIIKKYEEEKTKLKSLNEIYSKTSWINTFYFNTEVEIYMQFEERRKIGYKIFLQFNKLLKQTKVKTKPIVSLGAKEHFYLFKKLGFLELDFVKTLKPNQLKSLMYALIPKDKRTIDGIINNEKPTSEDFDYVIGDENKKRVEIFLKELKDI